MIDSRFPFLEVDEFFRFPPPEESTPEGIVALGGNLSPGMLVSAYSQGIFPWFSEGDPLYWWSPDPRCVLFPGKEHISGSMRRVLRKRLFHYSMDMDFRGVIEACARIPRPGQDGTWITPDMQEAYIALHQRGLAHSIEVWSGDGLAGGLYGISLGGMFFGESMFSRISNASKAAFIVLARILEAEDFDCLDCQLPTDHLARLGAQTVTREHYLRILKESLKRENRTGSWTSMARRNIERLDW